MLHHSDPTTCFGTNASPTPPLRVPVSLVYACRADDVLMGGEVEAWCAAATGRARLHRFVLAVSDVSPPAHGDAAEGAAASAAAPAAPFASQAPPPAEWAPLSALPNASRVAHRVTRELLLAELTALEQSTGGPCRVVVSGPAGFNGAVREMLVACSADLEMVTILSA